MFLQVLEIYRVTNEQMNPNSSGMGWFLQLLKTYQKDIPKSRLKASFGVLNMKLPDSEEVWSNSVHVIQIFNGMWKCL